MRRLAAGLAAAAITALPAAPALACSARTKPDPRVPTWRAVNGFSLGTRPASDAQIDAYLAAVDGASDRVRVLQAGMSTAGRPIRYAVVGTPGHVAPAPLEALAAQARAVRDGALSATAVGAFADTSPAFVWIGGTVHGNEPSGGDADMQLLHRLAAGRTCNDQRRLRALVTFILPMQNPDGRAAGTHVDADRFDLNRDWFALTQPETQAKLSALAAYPPTVFADQHEESGSGFFFPPNADPVHHEISSAALHAINVIVAPRLRRAFHRRHTTFTNYNTYDLFYMGYGDTVPATQFGAAGMTFEAGGQSPFRQRFAKHFLAADTTITAAAANRRALLARWGRQWLQAAAQGTAGTLQPNRVVKPGDTVRFQVPGEKVYGYAIRAAQHAADATALAHRLVLGGVHVWRLTQDVAVGALRPYGGAAAGPATLAAGTFYVPMAQAAKHWVQALLGEDPYAPFPYFYDVSSWSNPLLMGLDAGVLDAPIDLPAGAAQPVAADDRVPEAGAAPAYAFPGGSEGALELAARLAAGGYPVRRMADGSFAFPSAGAAGDDPAHNLAVGKNVALTALDAPPAGGTAVPVPKVAIFSAAGFDDSPGDLSAGWVRWLVTRRYGFAPAQLSNADIAGGKLAAYTTLLVPDGPASTGELNPAALAALQTWVRGGGTLIGWRGRGLAVARAAGLTADTQVTAPSGFTIPGALIRVTLDGSDPVATGEQGESFVFNSGDPILAANGAPVLARYPAGARVFVSGYTAGSAALEGTPAATDEVAGTGRVVLFAFEPAFRGYTEATERLLGNALLAPAPTVTQRRSAAARALRPIDPSALGFAARPYRDTVVTVAAEDEATLLRVARAAGLRARFSVERDLTTVTLRVPNPRGLLPERRPWTLRLPGALAAAGVHPLIAVL